MSVIRTQLRGLASRPTRLLLTSLAVIVATAFAYATFLVQDVVKQTLSDSFSTTTPATSVVVKSDEKPLTDKVIADVKAAPGVAQVAAQGTAYAQAGGIGLFIRSDPGRGPLSLVTVKSGHFPSQAGEIALTPDSAKDGNLKVGDTVAATLPDTKKTVRLTVSGIVEGHDSGGGYVSAAGLSALGGQVYRLNISAAAGTDATALVNRIKPLAPGATVQDGATVRAADASEATRAVDSLFLVLRLFVLVAVLAAGLVAASTFRIVFAQRMRQLALLRSIGAKRGKIVGALTIEGAVTGLVAGVAGVLAALGISYAVIAVVRATGVKITFPAVDLLVATACVLGAVVVTVASVLAPAVSASRVAPVAALRTAAVADAAKKVSWGRLALGILCIGAAVVVALGAVVIHSPEVSALGIVVSGAFAFGALLALGPFVVPPIARVIGLPATALSKVTGRLAIRNASRSPRRIAATTSVVALGVTLVTGLLVGTSSMQAYADARLAAQFPTAVIAAGENIPASAVQKLAQHPAIGVAVPVHAAEVGLSANGNQLPGTTVNSMDVAKVPSLQNAKVAGGGPSDVRPGTIGLPTTLAGKLGVHVGDSVVVTSKNHSVTVKVAATWETGFGIVVLPADLAKVAPDAPISQVLIDPASGHTAVEASRAAASALPGVQVQDIDQARAQYQGPLATVTLIALGLLALTVLIAVTGVATTMSLSIVERTTESGLLRALGLSRRGLRGSIVLESAVFGLVGAAIGLVLGTLYAGLLLGVLQIGIGLVVPVGELAGVVAVLVVLTLLAGWLPSRRAARISPVEALATS
ncbi:ABC transporter permease [Fodinicola acaciae]|uniref:ABC transporter permease n=1 Tax=Fodinicola acaciae TaxID=2681555 RepID=UPI0013D03A13|nr:FtsX-like permease family protein [Fodinicola acaciae]